MWRGALCPAASLPPSQGVVGLILFLLLHSCTLHALTLSPHPALLLQNLTGITATPLRGGKFLYTHAATGYRFEVGPAPPEAESETEYEEEGGGDNEEADSEVFDMIYRVVDLGTARPLLERQPLGESLMASFTFPQSQREWLMRTVMDALARAPHP